MLDRLEVNRFKSWKQLDIKLGNVTGIFGTNSSGKSSILQFLLMLKQTKNATDRGIVLDLGSAGQLVNLGSYRDLIYAHDEESKLEWQIDWSLPDAYEILNPSGKRNEVLFSGDNLSINSSVHQDAKGLSCDKLSYSLGDNRFSIAPKKPASTEFQLDAEVPSSTPFKFIRNQQRVWSLPGPQKTYLFPDQAKTYFQNSAFLSGLEVAYESMMDSIFYLGPLRDYPKREYSWSGSSPADVGFKGEQTIAAILSATARNEIRNRGNRTRYVPFQEIVAYWLKELGLIHSFKIEEIGKGANLYRVVVKRDENSPDALLTDVGFGVSQVLPALVLLHYVPEYSTVIMEQPEIHLHPAVQSGLADVIMSVAMSRNLQIIVESHSEHILRRFQRRVAESKFAAAQLKLYFCRSENGKSHLEDLEIDLLGEIHNWPPNFFGDEMTEIAETRKSILKRKMQETTG
jgi:predicted ATPase